uniref:Ovule protein n=1 Tax=Heterorhabditis bacteriophora TaxID=37862 RepID=A0A1I7W8B6_HETBA
MKSHFPNRTFVYKPLAHLNVNFLSPTQRKNCSQLSLSGKNPSSVHLNSVEYQDSHSCRYILNFFSYIYAYISVLSLNHFEFPIKSYKCNNIYNSHLPVVWLNSANRDRGRPTN